MPKLAVDQIEETYGITSREVRNAIQDGFLEGERNHGVWVVEERSLQEAIAAGKLKNRKQAS